MGQNETAAHCFAAKHGIYLKYLHEEMTKEEKPLLSISGDNDQATLFAQEDLVSSGNKYYYLPYYWIKEVEGVLIESSRVETVNNLSDLMTKAVDLQTINYLEKRINGVIGPAGTLFEFDLAKAEYLPP